MTDTVKITLPETDIPKDWYNLMADLPSPPPPPIHPGTGQPIGPDDLAPLFPMALIGQEVSMERGIEIPQPVCATFTASGGLLHCTARTGWKARSIRRHASITSMKG